MAKAKTAYVCSECGASSPKWVGQCPSCNAWNSLTETVVAAPSPSRVARLVPSAATQASPLSHIEAEKISRRRTGIGEFDRVLGGGLVAGSVVLIGGDPGIGK